MAVGWLECWLWRPEWKGSLWESSWPSTPPLSPLSDTDRDCGPLCIFMYYLLNCSRVHYVCKGTTVSAAGAEASAAQTEASWEILKPLEGWEAVFLCLNTIAWGLKTSLSMKRVEQRRVRYSQTEARNTLECLNKVRFFTNRYTRVGWASWCGC